MVLGHDDPEEWQGPFLTAAAISLAQAGFLVARPLCSSSDGQQRMRAYEKALDVCATSPFARSVQRWVLAGIGSGAQVAAVVGQRCRGAIAGFALLGYPLQVCWVETHRGAARLVARHELQPAHWPPRHAVMQCCSGITTPLPCGYSPLPSRPRPPARMAVAAADCQAFCAARLQPALAQGAARAAPTARGRCSQRRRQ